MPADDKKNMRLIVAATDLSIPLVHERVIDETGSLRLDDDTRRVVAAWVNAYLVEFDEYCTGRPPA